MAFPWLPPIPPAIFAAQSPEMDIVIQSRSQRRDFVTNETVFSDVVVTYGPTIIRAEELRVQDGPDVHNATAKGQVRIEDPDVNLTASNIFITWGGKQRSAFAEDIQGELAGAYFSAKRAILNDLSWTIEEIEGTTYRKDNNLYFVRSPRLIVTPGKSGVVRKPSLYVFGMKLVTLPWDQRFSLDPRASGVGYPRLSYDPDRGVGIGWSPRVFLNDRTVAGLGLSIYPNSFPSYGASLSRTFLKTGESTAKIGVSDDLGERFNSGYFDNVESARTGSDFGAVGAKRNDVTVSSTFNQRSTNFGTELRYSRPLDIAYQQSGRVSDLALLGQVRYQVLDSQYDDPNHRGIFYGTVAPRPWPIATGLNAYTRLDGAAYIGDTDFGWARWIAGAAYRPVSWLTVGGAGVIGSERGASGFENDHLYATNGAMARIDLNFGPTRAAYLYKWDEGLGWYDREWRVSQIAGPVELFVVSRQYPQSYRYGMKLRLDRLIDTLQRRDFSRSTTPHVISSPLEP